jgi:hypothetical protein
MVGIPGFYSVNTSALPLTCQRVAPKGVKIGIT